MVIVNDKEQKKQDKSGAFIAIKQVRKAHSIGNNKALLIIKHMMRTTDHWSVEDHMWSLEHFPCACDWFNLARVPFIPESPLYIVIS